MATMDSPLLPELDPETFGHDSGPVALTHLTHDIDGDGVLDTQTFSVGDSTVVASDTDGDGDADHLTMFDSDGGFESWEFRRADDGSESWTRTDEGSLSGL
ncbi:hypothetical protein G4H71_12725 [Rhodococcus triatomae]|nr:DUF6802 family protein [Rhodococcus triatomae]QNG20313.1 hypothetical protein G4H72_17655 [Rhodococcus triatomae]QNG23771.1 hypothetical protein G4H71_12725 [Rhodococcus triatomae]